MIYIASTFASKNGDALVAGPYSDRGDKGRVKAVVIERVTTFKML